MNKESTTASDSGMRESMKEAIDELKETDSYIFVIHTKKHDASVIFESRKNRAFKRLIENELNSLDNGSRPLDDCVTGLKDKINDICQQWRENEA